MSPIYRSGKVNRAIERAKREKRQAHERRVAEARKKRVEARAEAKRLAAAERERYDIQRMARAVANRVRKECEPERAAALARANEPRPAPIRLIVEPSVLSVMRADTKKRAYPWEGFGRND